MLKTTKLTLSYAHMGGDEPLVGLPLYTFLRQEAEKWPNREAVVFIEQGVRLTYAEFFDEVDKVAAGLLKLGLERGDRVGIWATDNVEWLLLQVATARVGAILVNINPAYRGRELEHALKAARIQTLVLMPAFRKSQYAEMVRELVPELEECGPEELKTETFPELRQVIVYDPAGAMATRRPAPGFYLWKELLALGAAVDRAELDRRSSSLDADDPINIQFTSGTTGFPKPVMLTHHNVLNNAYVIGRQLGFTQWDRLCVPVPFYHCFGMVISNLCSLARGAAIIVPAEHFDPVACLKAIETERCTAIHGVPTMFVAQLEVPDFDKYDLSTLRTGVMAGAPCPPELMKRVMGAMGCKEILIAYGQTEASPVTHMTHKDDSFEARVYTVGTTSFHQESKVVDPATGDIVPVGKDGEICIRGYNVMRGYYELEQATREAIDDAGWLHTGDIGVMDEDGYLKITGRLKEMIIRGGENIYPAEIEAYFYEHPKVRQVAVFGVPDERYGEEICAWIELKEGVEAEPDEFRAYIKKGMAHFKVPRHVRLVSEFPMTVTGKMQKFRMTELMSGELEQAPAQSS